MFRPTDLPSRTSHPSDGSLLSQRVHRHRVMSCTSAGRLNQCVAWSSARLQRLPHGYLRHAFIGLSIPIALIAGFVVPSARQDLVAGEPVAAAYAVHSAASRAYGDHAMTEAEAAVAFAADTDETDVAETEGVITLGHPVSTPTRIGTTEENVNLRRGPGTGTDVIAKLPSGVTLEVIGERAGWYRVATAKGTVGWVSADYLKVGTISVRPAQATAPSLTATITAGRVNLRQGPSTQYRSYGTLAEGITVQVIARSSDWFKVRSPRGTLGWVAGDLMHISSDVLRSIPVTKDVPPLPSKPVAGGPPRPVTPPPSHAPVALVSGDAASIAKQYVGSAYIWGGASPRGFDCSGLVLYVYQQLGLNLPHKASLQYNTPGQRLGSLADLAPGDLVFFVRTTSATGITHVGIYTGNGRMVTAGTPRTGVQEVSLSNQYWQSRFVGGVRPYR